MLVGARGNLTLCRIGGVCALGPEMDTGKPSWTQPFELAGRNGIEATGGGGSPTPAMEPSAIASRTSRSRRVSWAPWSELRDATPPGRYVGRPFHDEGRRVWEQYAFDPAERAKTGVRSREWTAVAPTELEVVRELARCLRLIREGRMPR